MKRNVSWCGAGILALAIAAFGQSAQIFMAKCLTVSAL